MTEPIYEFVKGKGWQLETVDSCIIQGHRFEVRKPLPGEMYTYCYPNSRWADETKVKWSEWKLLEGTFSFANFYKDGGKAVENLNVITVVAVPL